MTEDDTLNQTETLENPYSAYSVKFPYTVSFSFPDDDHNTKITIASTSVVLSYGREETDIPHQMKMNQKHSHATHAKHLINWIRSRLWNIDPREVDVTYGDGHTIKLMADEEIDQFREDFLNDE
ncbi:MAG: hypothetical protein ACPGQV_05305 [Alphaproteobacteria bacterium]